MGERLPSFVGSVVGPWRAVNSEGLTPPDFNAPGTRPAVVPGAWQHEFPDDAPGGPTDVLWYGCMLPAWSGRKDARDWVRFASVATDCRVWVNGKPVGGHVGDWTPFAVEVPPSDGARAMAVRVDRMRPGPVTFDANVPVNGGELTKGFHDVLSIQHAGIWGPVTFRRTGPVAIGASGVRAMGLPRGSCSGGRAPWGLARVEFELDAGGAACQVLIEVVDGSGRCVATHELGLDGSARAVSAPIRVEDVALWSPASPALYEARVRVLAGGALSDAANRRFGFREVRASGRRIHLNGEPLFLSGILDWGHEKVHVAPAPEHAEVRARLIELKNRGINLVCLCMYYPPEHFYDLADEVGVLLWQEHPVWKSRMGESDLAHYRRRYLEFFARDQGHPSVIIVSGSCEHERFHPELARWWRETARAMLPERITQAQTAFIEWAASEHSDLDDEHTYESSGRWPAYLADVDAALAEREPRPFVLGESVLYVSWPRTEELFASIGGDEAPRPWWFPKGLEALRALERDIAARHGPGELARLRAVADRYHLEGRAFQTQVFRANPDHAGLVHNSVIDMPVVRCGLIDDLGDWRFTPAQMRPWLAPSALILRTPDWRRGFFGGQAIDAELGLSHFGHGTLCTRARLRARYAGSEVCIADLDFEAPPGEVTWARVRLDLPETATPGTMELTCAGEGLEPTTWRLWVLPRPGRAPGAGVCAALGRPYAPEELVPDFEERRYSSGWGLSRVTFAPRPPIAAACAPWAGTCRVDSTPPDDTRVVITHRISTALLAWVEGGGRLIALAHKGRGTCPTGHVNMWGLTPFVPPGSPFDPREAAEDLLDHDLSRRWIRSIPSQRLGFADQVDPVVRYLYTHDMTERVRIEEGAFAARLGSGVICVSSLDHAEDAGQWALHALATWIAEVKPERRLDPLIARAWATWEG
ncbi:MAG: hypothetical protein IT439_12205 [Phycisphaerales bacterium]|nr:hypothetical protein [Phycisphaerales bacterium]